MKFDEQLKKVLEINLEAKVVKKVPYLFPFFRENLCFYPIVQCKEKLMAILFWRISMAQFDELSNTNS